MTLGWEMNGGTPKRKTTAMVRPQRTFLDFIGTGFNTWVYGDNWMR
jgi:hypothetical protein